MTDGTIPIPCPFCEKRGLETAATAPYVRGLVLAYEIGSKTFVGCRGCVRLKMLQEAGLSALIGWFSISALFINPVLIVYNVVRAIFVSTNLEKVRLELRKLGIPEPSGVEFAGTRF